MKVKELMERLAALPQDAKVAVGANGRSMAPFVSAESVRERPLLPLGGEWEALTDRQKAAWGRDSAPLKAAWERLHKGEAVTFGDVHVGHDAAKGELILTDETIHDTWWEDYDGTFGDFVRVLYDLGLTECPAAETVVVIS